MTGLGFTNISRNQLIETSSLVLEYLPTLLSKSIGEADDDHLALSFVSCVFESMPSDSVAPKLDACREFLDD
jgi:hypothetical protein